MNVRCYRFDTKEFYYPNKNSAGVSMPLDLVEFYTVLEGYRLKGIKYEITWSSDVFDIEKREVFAADRVRLIFPPERNINMFPNPTEDGAVDYQDGCFVFIGDLEPDFVRALDSELFSIKILGHSYADQD